MIFANDEQPANLADLLKRTSDTSVLVFWAELGEEPEMELGERYADTAPNAESWEVPGATHIGGLTAQREDYERQVVAFFDRTLGHG